uniref:protein-serine/threonine phosphatase n=1 Tax=Pavo cristatus TaxID=9049 RepID=A0A8C9L9N4_PAVCR
RAAHYILTGLKAASPLTSTERRSTGASATCSPQRHRTATHQGKLPKGIQIHSGDTSGRRTSFLGEAELQGVIQDCSSSVLVGFFKLLLLKMSLIIFSILYFQCFCSNFCYKASKYFEAQISKSPVWMREEEIPSDIELLKKGQSGQSGEEVKLCDEVIKASDIENPRLSSNPCESASYGTASDSSSDTEQEFVSSVLPGSQSSSASLAQQLHRKSILKKKHVQKVYSSPKSEDSDVVEVTERLSNCKLDAQEEMHACTVQKKITATSSKTTTPGKSNASENCENTCSNSQIVFLGVSKKGAEYLKTLVNSKQHEKIELRDSIPSSAAKCSLLELLKQTLTEWRTEETLKFLYGPNYTLCSSECLSSANQENEELDEDDLDTPEDLNDAAVGKSENSLNYSLPFMGSGETVKPVPSYEKLKEETEFLQLRVREFYKGKCILAEEDVNYMPNLLHKNFFSFSLPLMSSNGILGPLQITLGDVYTELKNLVKTFRSGREQQELLTLCRLLLLKQFPLRHLPSCIMFTCRFTKAHSCGI